MRHIASAWSFTVHKLSANAISKPQKDRVKCVARKAIHRIIIDRQSVVSRFGLHVVALMRENIHGTLTHIFIYLLYWQRSKLIITQMSADFETLGAHRITLGLDLRPGLLKLLFVSAQRAMS